MTAGLQREDRHSLLPQRGFAAGPHRPQRVQAALDRRRRQQRLAKQQQTANSQDDSIAEPAEHNDAIIASEDAASDRDIASVVGHPGA